MRNRGRRALLAAVGAVVVSVAAIPAGAPAAGVPKTTGQPVCLPVFGAATCNALVLSDASGNALSVAAANELRAVSYTPAQLHTA